MEKFKVHFMGIGGSGMAGVALLAKAAGFEVSGCDLSSSSYYRKFLLKEGIKPQLGHAVSHLQGINLLAVSPAIFAVNPDHPEVIEAKKRRILVTWQEFMGKYLQKDKFVIAVAGTHGKSTTTALTGWVLQEAGFDPTVELGAIVPSWDSTIRVGKSKYFVCEADEFNNNFLNYMPGVAIINNIEMDHPEFFQDFVEFLGAFEKFVKRMVAPKILIVNEDNRGIQELLLKMKNYLMEEEYQVLGYRLGEGFSFPFQKEYQGQIVKQEEERTEFLVNGEKFQLKIPGVHNVANSLGVIACALSLGADQDRVKKTLASFENLGRRLEKIGEEKRVAVYDDYGHHPTAIAATIAALRQKEPGARLWVVFEPHQFSRLKIFKKEFAKALKTADQIVVTKVFAGREKPIEGVDGQALVKAINSSWARYIEDFDKVAQVVSREAKRGDVILVFGAGKSYELSKEILEKLKNGK